MTAKRVIGYIRVSTEDQAEDGASLASQRGLITATTKLRGWTLVDIVEDTASGKNLRRKGITEVLARLAAKEADVLMAVALDRVSRSTADVARLMQLSADDGWRVLALNGDVDTTTPMGEAFIGISAVFAQLERRMISTRTKAGMAQRKLEGVHLGRRTGLPDDVLDLVRSLHACGLGPGRIARVLTREGVQTPSGSLVWSKAAAQSAMRVAGVLKRRAEIADERRARAA